MALQVETAPAAAEPAPEGRRRRARQLLRWVLDHPVLTVGLVAAAARLGSIVVIALSTDGVVIPDETQYLALARWISDGQDPASYGLGYGQSLLRYTPAFVRPLSWCFEIFGEGRVPASVYVAAFGVATAVLTTVLARRLLRPGLAVLAGLVVALLPSQVLFSSVVIREAMIWSCIVAAAIGVMIANEAVTLRRLLWGAAIAAASILALGWLRDQTLLVAVWVLVPAAALGIARFRWWRVAGAVVLLVVIPMAGGVGPAGRTLLATVIPQLGTVRTNLSMSAESAFTATTLLPRDTTPPPTLVGGAPAPTTTTTIPPNVVHGYAGEQYLVDESAGASLKAAPRGFVAVMFRPFPWEGHSGSMKLAAAENVVWYPLYVLAAVGLWMAWRLRSRELVFPLLFGFGIVLTSAVTQGNLGTTFRHRGQVLWLVVILAALGVQAVLVRRAERRRSVAMSSTNR